MFERIATILITVLTFPFVFPYLFCKRLFEQQDWESALAVVAFLLMIILGILFFLPFSVPSVLSKVGIAVFLICAALFSLLCDSDMILIREQRRTNELLEELKNQGAAKGHERD